MHSAPAAVRLCENPAVLATADRTLNTACPPLVCLQGPAPGPQPSCATCPPTHACCTATGGFNWTAVPRGLGPAARRPPPPPGAARLPSGAPRPPTAAPRALPLAGHADHRRGGTGAVRCASGKRRAPLTCWPVPARERPSAPRSLTALHAPRQVPRQGSHERPVALPYLPGLYQQERRAGSSRHEAHREVNPAGLPAPPHSRICSRAYGTRRAGTCRWPG
ncbi:DUF2399 domain-containing protein [Streptomyces sp. NPDC001774]